jgi:hypothetical protein
VSRHPPRGDAGARRRPDSNPRQPGVERKLRRSPGGPWRYRVPDWKAGCVAADRGPGLPRKTFRDGDDNWRAHRPERSRRSHNSRSTGRSREAPRWQAMRICESRQPSRIFNLPQQHQPGGASTASARSNATRASTYIARRCITNARVESPTEDFSRARLSSTCLDQNLPGPTHLDQLAQSRKFFPLIRVEFLRLYRLTCHDSLRLQSGECSLRAVPAPEQSLAAHTCEGESIKVSRTMPSVADFT